ncbi:hypothetical protein B9Q02_03460 [Candidatus Marsarchaeota G1 archaeon BE_D]|uniref:Uncharacterized protein n=1 Tax=Candidatus Marsarchaeota G1 archaeon BE_D TaxID=1978156 RepID=A0A2R6AIE0_9ARCH|nr:MAG: hypothetical protein B9Q02_03460 [Candidatus Marsarchaeota G1 archaeon BE_D]
MGFQKNKNTRRIGNACGNLPLASILFKNHLEVTFKLYNTPRKRNKAMIEMSFGNSLYTLEGFQALQVDNRL